MSETGYAIIIGTTIYVLTRTYKKVIMNALLGLVSRVGNEINEGDRIKVKGKDGTYEGEVEGQTFKNLNLLTPKGRIDILHEYVYDSDVIHMEEHLH